MKEPILYGVIIVILLIWLLKLLFFKRNTFRGALIEYDIIKKYYRDDPTFDRFIFQQLIKKGKRTDDDYELIAYAINNKGEVMNNDIIPVKKLTDRSYPRNMKVNFANIELYKEQLKILYPLPQNNAVLRLYPEPFLDTNYVSYSAETINSPVTVVKLNPCPPGSIRNASGS